METAGEGKDGNPGAMALNPGIPIRGIKMKFAVLAGLVEVGEVSNRDIVETAFNLVSWIMEARNRPGMHAGRRHAALRTVRLNV